MEYLNELKTRNFCQFLLSRCPVQEWKPAIQKGIELEIIDLRDHEWEMKNDVVVKRKSLTGDPKGKVLVDLLGERSEFWEHRKSQRGYYGADYDRAETKSHTMETVTCIRKQTER